MVKICVFFSLIEFGLRENSWGKTEVPQNRIGVEKESKKKTLL